MTLGSREGGQGKCLFLGCVCRAAQKGSWSVDSWEQEEPGAGSLAALSTAAVARGSLPSQPPGAPPGSCQVASSYAFHLVLPFFVSRALMFLAALHRAQRAAGFAGASQLWPLPGVDMGTLELGRELGLPLGANSFFLWLRVQEMFFFKPPAAHMQPSFCVLGIKGEGG